MSSKSASKTMTVDSFRSELKRSVEQICSDLGKSYDNNQGRGYAFQIWAADLLLGIEGIPADGADYVFASNDLNVDILFDDEEDKLLCIGQTKYVSANSDIKEDEVTSFLERHDVFLKQKNWVRKHASDELFDTIASYKEMAEAGWRIKFYFISTGKASDRLKTLIAEKQE